MSELGAAAQETLSALARRLGGEVEVYEKRGRSRSLERAADRESAHLAHEAGWAVRAGDSRRSLFYAATGAPAAGALLPDPSANPLLLPECVPDSHAPPRELTPPFATENEAGALFDGIARRLASELSGARLIAARIDEGSSEAFLVSTLGARASTTARAAWLRLEAETNGSTGRRVELVLAEPTAKRFDAGAIAQRLAARLTALAPGGSALPEPAPGAGVGSGPILLAAPLAARLVEAIAPLFLGRAAPERLGPLLGEAARIASPAVTLIDDGGFVGGLGASPVDGEGVRTGRVVLIEEGRFRSPLLAWWEAPRPGERPPGCARRASFRDLPRRAPTQLYLEPGAVAAADLVAAAPDALYLIDAESGVALDRAALTFSVAVSGFRLRGGDPATPLGEVRLAGSLAALLGSVRALARDLDFVPGDGLFGAPTLLVESAAGESGLALVPRSAAGAPAGGRTANGPVR